MQSLGFDIPVGTEFAGHRITGVLGQGGMSTVFRAEHLRLGRTVALKILAPALADDESFRERFLRESRLAAALDHPNVIPIFDAGESEGFLYIAMRHVEGSDVRTLIAEQGPLGLGQTLFIVEQVASALDAAHEHGLVHRDVKSANILIARPGERVYLTDFGIVKQASTQGLTKTGLFLGTFDYAAPEQIEGKEIDGRSDVYSLGCVLYECLSGQVPYKRDTEGAVIRAHLIESPPKVTLSRPDLPADINPLIASALAKTKEDRPATCGELAAALRSVALGRTFVPSSTASGAPATVAASSPETVLAEPEPRHEPEQPAPPAEPPQHEDRPARAGRRGVVPALVAVAVGLAAVAGVLAVVLTQGGGEPDVVGEPAGAAPPAATDAGTPPAETAGEADATEAAILALVPGPAKSGCTELAAPAEAGAEESVVCLPSADAPANFPDRWEMSTFPNAAAASAVYEAELRARGVESGSGTCTGASWGGEAEWIHGPGRPGGRRFCYFDGSDAVLVWTHDRLGQPDHKDVLIRARNGGADHAELNGWWRFWVHRLGKAS